MQGQTEIKKEGETLVAILPPEIDHHGLIGVREQIDRALFEARPHLLVLDFSDVRFMDSSGIGLILGRCEVCEHLSATVRLCGASRTVMKLLKISGLEKIKNLSISDS